MKSNNNFSLKRKRRLIKLMIFITMFIIIIVEINHWIPKTILRHTKFPLKKAPYVKDQDRTLEILVQTDSLEEKSLHETTMKEDTTKENSEKDDSSLGKHLSTNDDEEQKSRGHLPTEVQPVKRWFKNIIEIDGKEIELSKRSGEYRKPVIISTNDVENVSIQATEWLTVNDTEKDDRLNKHKFVYHLNSNLCSKKNISVVILVHSAVKHAGKRHLIRSTWGSVNTSVSQPTIIFLLGESFPENKRIQTEIEKESKEYGDIVQGDFVDTYKNLTYKHVMAIHWLTSQCDDVRTIVKIDDDVFVDVDKLAKFSVEHGSIPNCVYCHALSTSRTQRGGKWAVTNKEYPFELFPPYCAGAAYIMSMDVARRLDRASADLGFFWVDDVYVTGFLRRIAGVDLRQFKPGQHRTLTVRNIFSLLTYSSIRSHMFFTGKFDWNYLMTALFKGKAK